MKDGRPNHIEMADERDDLVVRMPLGSVLRGLLRAEHHDPLHEHPGQVHLVGVQGAGLDELLDLRDRGPSGHRGERVEVARGLGEDEVAVLSADRMCLCGMLAAEYRTLPEPLQLSVSAFFDTNTGWLRGVLQQGSTEGSLRLLGSPDDVAAMVLGGLEGAMLITRLDGDVARFTAAADRLLGGLASVPA